MHKKSKSSKFTLSANLPILLSRILILAVFSTVIFWMITATTGEAKFLSHQFTSGSDDYEYLNAGVLAASGNNENKELSEIVDEFYYFSLHSPGYPVLLYILFILTSPSIYFGIFLNSVFLWISTYLSGGLGTCRDSSVPKLLAIIASMPGLLLVSFHLYKDVILLALVLVAIANYKKGNFVLAIFFAALTHYFRPFNWILLLMAVLIIKKPGVVFSLLLICFGVVLVNPEVIDLNMIQSQIQLAQSVAIRDMQTYGSSYEPVGNFLLDYLIGLGRFVLLPIPFSIDWVNRPLVFSLLEFFQSTIIYLTLFLGLFNHKIIIKSVKDNQILFGYAFLQSSTYAVLYFGNAEPRFRVLIFVCVGILIRSIIKNNFHPKAVI
jgi:hypothetical protein